ncbi:MAG: hypothetical protein [Bacteriophage sp.]|nr:MAG: hypothetical protein [Bacteriophage sp.]
MSNVFLCYEKNNVIFIATLHKSDIDKLRTNKLLGANTASMRVNVDILSKDTIALVTQDIHRMYRVPDSNFRIHLDPCISSDMNWESILPTDRYMNVVIFFEDNP